MVPTPGYSVFPAGFRVSVGLGNYSLSVLELQLGFRQMLEGPFVSPLPQHENFVMQLITKNGP